MTDGESWRQVVDSDHRANWKVTDVAQLGPPPRTLTPAHEKYIKRATASAVATLVIAMTWLSVISFGMAIAIVGANANTLGTPIAMVIVAVLVARARNRNRDRLRTVLRDGDLRMAMLQENIQIEVGRGLGKRRRYHARFSIDGKPITLVTWDDGMSMLPIGSPAEVVCHPEYPDLIIPAFLLV